jgi:hypothetical protein
MSITAVRRRYFTEHLDDARDHGQFVAPLPIILQALHRLGE